MTTQTDGLSDVFTTVQSVLISGCVVKDKGTGETVEQEF